jgi:Sec-independent protein translocase protein TatA
MDPISVIAGSAAAVFGTKMLEETGSQAGKALSAVAGKLVAWVRQLGKKDSEVNAAVTMVQADPADQTRVELLGKVLETKATADPEVATQLRELVEEVRRAGDVHASVGGAHIHGNLTGGTVSQVGGNQYNLGDPVDRP